MGGRGSSGGSGIKVVPAKVGDKIVTADWFNFELPSYAIQTNRAQIIGESASGKAWKVPIECDWNVISVKAHEVEIRERVARKRSEK